MSTEVAKNYVYTRKKFFRVYDILTEDTAKEFLRSIISVNTYNNTLSALKQPAYMYRCNLDIKHKRECHEKPIIAPSYDVVAD